jgi:lipoate-protein ligase A
LPQVPTAQKSSSRCRPEAGMKLRNLQIFHDTEPRSAAENMALDEALFLQTMLPVIRSYRWIRSALSFGYFTPWKSVAEYLRGRDPVRRWTGGGIVEHGDDFTYSIVLPGHNSFASVELYHFVHGALAELLRECGHSVEISQFRDVLQSNACFERAVEFDLKVCGAKIAGAAIRRSRRGVLLQGSIQRLDLPEYFTSMFANALCEQPERFVLSRPVMEITTRIAKDKYAAAEWTHRF